MYEASKQCERAKIPQCFSVTDLGNVIDKKFDRIIVFGERSTEQSLKKYLSNNPIIKDSKSIATTYIYQINIKICFFYLYYFT